MKQLLSLFIVMPIISFGQIIVTKQTTIGKYRNGPYTIAELSYSVSGSDTGYTFRYLNQKNEDVTEYKEIRFIGSNTLDQFYSLLKTVFTDENKKNKDYKIEFKIGNTDVVASNYRVIGITSVLISTPEGIVNLSEKQLDKVFGK